MISTFRYRNMTPERVGFYSLIPWRSHVVNEFLQLLVCVAWHFCRMRDPAEDAFTLSSLLATPFVNHRGRLASQISLESVRMLFIGYGPMIVNTSRKITDPTTLYCRIALAAFFE